MNIAILTYIKVVTAKLDEPHEGLMECRSIAKEIYAVQTIVELLNRFLSEFPLLIKC